MATVLIGLMMSGCTEQDVRPSDDNITDAPANATNDTLNASEQAGSQSVSIPLQKPPFID
ncbi:hypothetical protein FHEFKHOI_01776 [Candidatus Methanoperedenaceae archaeon GB50]|nr:MAG: hypothetical protein KBONHNOK_00131 [Candidatus Methanoperedenaceae archaeon GB50]CAD7775363.1 hypothetical protein AIOGIFDO_01769 [Candidatus Methanoperedenaceae archaeon GB37]CAD7775457.1 hypothetical protein FHEFKHOI_01776 [Candidatus Methanoperedenaceae archaeon GB50]